MSTPSQDFAAQHAAAPGPAHTPPRPPLFGLHYGWWIVLSAILSVFVSMGVGRFALGMLLPAMGEALNLSYVQMGWISTGNFIGYLLGALLVRRLLPRLGERRLIAITLMTIVATMAGVSVVDGFLPLVILYSGTGMSTAMAFVSVVALLPHWFTTRWRGLAAGLLSAGAGLAMMLSGWCIPLINDSQGEIGWRLGWGGLAAVCLPIAIFCYAVMRNRPGDLGLRPFGEAAGAEDGGGATLAEPTGAPQMTPRRAAAPGVAAARFLVVRLAAIYFLFGASYVVYGTFIVTTLVREHGMAEAKAGQFWIWTGFFSLFCGPVLGALSDRLGRRAGITTAFILQGCAYVLISQGSGGGDWPVYLSVILYGLSMFGVPLIITAAAADYLSPDRAAAVIGTISIFQGIGQMLGPIAAGAMAEYSGSFTPAYLAATALVALAIALTLTLPDPPE
ncbi:MAG: YbfB/YjiJ family MFS transporter [Alphaproteobacteria bacterium]|jgi:MFS family permease|nr:YbfB/YjiJ family MFS transporter [Alphaproteobacteria bacterium]MDP6831508.1 YbfB/YjiJ family MFS transporter [Alphaproteobacteria bacterium]